MGGKHMQIRQRGFADALLLLGYAVAAIAVGAIIFAAWRAFTNQYRDEGRAEVREEWAALISECEKTGKGATAHSCAEAWRAAVSNERQASANFARCDAAMKEQSAAVDEANRRAETAITTTRRILAEIAKRSEATAAEVTKLRQIAATPAASRKEACDEADALLTALATRRMRWHPDGPAPGSGSADGNGKGSGSGSLRITR